MLGRGCIKIVIESRFTVSLMMPTPDGAPDSMEAQNSASEPECGALTAPSGQRPTRNSSRQKTEEKTQIRWVSHGVFGIP